MKYFLTIPLLSALFIVSTTRSVAQDAPELSLRQAIELALKDNLGLRIQKLEPEIAKEDVTISESSFDPNLFSRASINQSELEWEQLDDTPQQSTSDSRSYALGVRKRIDTGAEITASIAHTRSDGSSFNPELGQLVGGGLRGRASFALEITQPLLRDFGKDANLSQLRAAQSRERVADLQTRVSIMNLLEDTEVAYWNLADAYERRTLIAASIELSERLLEEAKEREILGVATQLDILQAEANLAQKQEEILRAEQNISERADALLVAMGQLDDSTNIASSPIVSKLPEPIENTKDFESLRSTAFDLNFDTDIQEEILEQLEQERIRAKNARKPEVDLTLSTAYNGLSPRSSHDALNEALDRKGDDWGLSLSFNLPWGSRAANSNVRQTKWRIEQAENRLAEIRQNLLLSIRSSFRSLTTAKEQLRSARLVLKLQEATFAQERGKYDEGLSTFRVLLEAQRDVDQAQLRFLDAKLNAIQSEIRAARVEGTLLFRHRLDWNQPLLQQP